MAMPALAAERTAGDRTKIADLLLFLERALLEEPPPAAARRRVALLSWKAFNTCRRRRAAVRGRAAVGSR
jgi:hypothetical protein